MSTTPFSIEVDEPVPAARPSAPSGPIILEDASTERMVVKHEAVLVPEPEPALPPSKGFHLAAALFGLGLLGLAGLSVGDWLVALADRHWTLAVAGGVFVGATTLGAAIWILSELGSLRRLRTVETFHERAMRIKDDERQTAALLDEVGRSLPSGKGSDKFDLWRKQAGGEKAKVALQVFNKEVLGPLDADAAALVRRASFDAMLLVSMSPTPVTDTAVFLARASSLITGVARVYGHRPGYAATGSLFRRVIREVGVLAAADVIGDAMSNAAGDLLGKALGKITVSAGEGIVAAQRMARLGLLAMAVCRPLPFPDEMKPKLTDLVFH